MSGKLMNENCLKPVCSITELAKSLGLSRGRFYQLVEKGTFPYPVYDIRTRRPFYTKELQDICHEVRRTNIGWNRLPILFYTPRKKYDPTLPTSSSPQKREKETNPRYREISEALINLGVQKVTATQIRVAVKTLFPGKSIDSIDQGLLLRQLFRHFKSQVS